MKAVMSAEYKNFFKEIKERIHKAQYDAFKAALQTRNWTSSSITT